MPMAACSGSPPIEPQRVRPASSGTASRVYNVIDTRQSYLQDVVVAGLRALGYNEQADRSTHFNYEMVALSPRCCADLGIRSPKKIASGRTSRSPAARASA